MVLALRALVVLVCVGYALSQASLDLSYSKNVSGSVTENGLQYRKVSMKSWSLGRFMGANYISISAEKKAGTASADVVAGACYVADGTHLFAFASYFEAVADWAMSVDSDSSFATVTNFSAADGYIGSAYLRIEEAQPNGKVVASQALRGSLFPTPDTGLNWAISDHTGTNGTHLKYVTFTGTPTTGNLVVAISFIASDIAGVLNLGAAVGPKSFESIVQIQNWPYQSPNNSLTLVLGVGTGSTSLSGSGDSLISKGSVDQVYFTLSERVLISGVAHSARIGYLQNTTDNIEDATFLEQLQAKYGGSATYKNARITFPAGATDITYDPTVGSGTTLEGQATGSAAVHGVVAWQVVVVGILAVVASCMV